MQGWSHQHQDEPDRIICFVRNVFDTKDAEYIAGGLPQRSHCYDPAVAFAVNDGLGNVRDESKVEKNSEEVCSSRIGAKVWPLTLWVCLSRAASHCD